MDWKKSERTFYLEKLRKATMEELYAAENPTSLSLVPDSIIRRQEAASSTLDSGKSDLTHSHFNDSYFEEHGDGSDLSEQNEDDLEESVAGGLSNHCGKGIQQPMDQGLFPSRVNQGKGRIIS